MPVDMQFHCSIVCICSRQLAMAGPFSFCPLLPFGIVQHATTCGTQAALRAWQIAGEEMLILFAYFATFAPWQIQMCAASQRVCVCVCHVCVREWVRVASTLGQRAACCRKCKSHIGNMPEHILPAMEAHLFSILTGAPTHTPTLTHSGEKTELTVSCQLVENFPKCCLTSNDKKHKKCHWQQLRELEAGRQGKRERQAGWVRERKRGEDPVSSCW